MAQMNKKPTHVSRKTELENELTGQIVDAKVRSETGKFEDETHAYAKQQRNKNRAFQIQQGARRRHPYRVLAQYDTIKGGTEHASSAWEKALLHETERVEVPSEYKPKQEEFASSQMGLVSTALKNYTKSKNRLNAMHPVGF